MNLATCNLRQLLSVIFKPAMPLPVSTSTTSVHIPTEVISEIIDDLENMHILTEPISPMHAQWMSYYPCNEREAHSRKLCDLLACRLVSRAFMDVCTPRVFKLVKITPNQWRINAFWTLFGDEKQNLRRHVRELIYKDGNDEQKTAGNDIERTLEAFSNLHLFPNLDTVRIYFHCNGLSAEDLAHEGTEDEKQNDLHLFKSMSSPYRRQLFVVNSLANAVNIPVKHLHVHGLYLLPMTANFFASSRRFMVFLSGLQTLSIHVCSLGLGFAWTGEFYVTFWKGIGRLLPAATNVTSLVLSSDRLSSGPPYEAWDAMSLPSLTSLTLEFFVFSDREAFGGVNTGLQGFLQRHLQAGSRLREVVLHRCCSTYGSDLVWAMVYDRITDLVSTSFHSALKSFEHTPSSWILQGENYVLGEHLGINLHDHAHQQELQAVLDLEAYNRLQAILGTSNDA